MGPSDLLKILLCSFFLLIVPVAGSLFSLALLSWILTLFFLWLGYWLDREEGVLGKGGRFGGSRIHKKKNISYR